MQAQRQAELDAARQAYQDRLGFGFGGDTSASTVQKNTKPVKQGGADDAAFLMKNASSVIIVPGYGMAVAQAQHALREMADKLKK